MIQWEVKTGVSMDNYDNKISLKIIILKVGFMTFKLFWTHSAPTATWRLKTSAPIVSVSLFIALFGHS